jgi:integrase
LEELKMADSDLVIVSEFNYSAIENAPLADSTKAQYTKAVRHYLATGNSLADAQALAKYAQGLNKSSRAFLKAAVRLLTEDLALAMKGGATPENVDQVQAGLYRLEAIQAAVKVKSSKGTKAHIWLSQRQVREIMATCGDGLVGQRDWIVLGLLLGAGLRREELVNLTFDALKDVPRRGGNGKRRTVLEVQGKGAKDRVVMDPKNWTVS